jgi:hypothetical protein
MAGISQKVVPDEVLPLLSRNVFLLGYQGPQSNRRPTEYLFLLMRYVQQARELAVLAGPQGVISIANCNEARPLLQILGYRTRVDCGQAGTFLETADPPRAFLTIDSGFPLPQLEKALQTGQRFTYPFPTSHMPVLFTEADWTRKAPGRNMLDTLLRDPALARLYWGMSRIDEQTQLALRQSPGLTELAVHAPALNFYGRHITIRSGRVIVPGGPSAEAAWKELVGASPASPGDFVLHLLAKDHGWAAAYFDALSRVDQTQQAHFTESDHLRRYYDALRGPGSASEAAGSAFRPDAGLVLLVARAQWEANGDPRVPGNLEVWKRILRQKSDAALESNVAHDLAKRSRRLDSPTHLLEAMFAVSRVQTETGPLQAYLLLTQLDAGRSPQHRLSPETVAAMTAKFSEYSNQYLIFSEFPSLDDTSIRSFIGVADGLNGMANSALRGNALGTFQANVGLWQILARQEQIPAAELNASWQRLMKPYTKVVTSVQVFDAGRTSLRDLLLASTGKPDASQDEIIDLIAGPHQTTPDGERIHQELADRIRFVLDGQRLVSLDTIVELGDGLHGVERVRKDKDRLLTLAGDLREFEMPRPIFSNRERDEWAQGIYNNRHTELQMRTDLTKVITSPGSAEQVAEARGELSSFLRDTLVGLNYAYYEPPGAQILHQNPLFVRSHDFSGDTVRGVKHVWQASRLFGAGSPAGGGAHLVGSLADLPYVLTEAEQDFLTPENVQALILGEMVRGIITSAVVPRWWGISPTELHVVTLHQQAGEELLAASVNNPDLRVKVMNILDERMVPQTSSRVERSLRAGELAQLLPEVTPADTFYLAAEFRRRFPGETDAFGTAGKEIESIAKEHPEDVRWERLSRDFGVPHPAVAQSYARGLLNLPPFPAFMGEPIRYLAESWDSNNLYWARLADEKGYSPVMLNTFVPTLTHRMVEKIFATDLEDWPALLRAMRETGEEFRQGKIGSPPAVRAASAP